MKKLLLGAALLGLCFGAWASSVAVAPGTREQSVAATVDTDNYKNASPHENCIIGCLGKQKACTNNCKDQNKCTTSCHNAYAQCIKDCPKNKE